MINRILKVKLSVGLMVFVIVGDLRAQGLDVFWEKGLFLRINWKKKKGKSVAPCEMGLFLQGRT